MLCRERLGERDCHSGAYLGQVDAYSSHGLLAAEYRAARIFCWTPLFQHPLVVWRARQSGTDKTAETSVQVAVVPV